MRCKSDDKVLKKCLNYGILPLKLVRFVTYGYIKKTHIGIFLCISQCAYKDCCIGWTLGTLGTGLRVHFQKRLKFFFDEYIINESSLSAI